MNTRIATKDIANFTKALTMAFDLLDNARIKISRTENARLLCQCHYLSNENQNESREAFCPSDLNGPFDIFSLQFSIDYDDFSSVLANPYKPDEPIFLDSTGCNKMIMIVTDGATETALNVFQTRNWHANNVSTCHETEVRQ